MATSKSTTAKKPAAKTTTTSKTKTATTTKAATTIKKPAATSTKTVAAVAEKKPATSAKAAPAKTAPPKAAPPKAAPAKAAARVQMPTPEQRYKMVQDAAYFIAERNSFASGSMDYWIAAEAEIEALLSGKGMK